MANSLNIQYCGDKFGREDKRSSGPLASFNPRDKAISRGASRGPIIMTMPYLTNLQEFPQGVWMTSAAKKKEV